MGKNIDLLETIESMIETAARHGNTLRTAEDERLDGRTLILGGKHVLNFGSCSYLGFEKHGKLLEGVIDATMRYGTQFSSSRSYISAPPYNELEGLLGDIFGGHVLAAPSTSLGHLAVLPTLISKEDAVILDQRVHHSVQVASQQLRPQGTSVSLIRHNQLDQLEEQLEALTRRHRHVWYLADGVYSMFATQAPVTALERLMGRYEQLHVYYDDSHGVGWHGRHGRGVVLEQSAIRSRMIVAASLNKSFAAAGAALVFPDEATMRKVRICGGPLIFSGPIQPPMLGAAIASARLHLSPELPQRQADLLARIRYCNALLLEHGLPLVEASEAPIRYIGLGAPCITYEMARRLLERGFYVNVALFPAVPMKQSGIRFTLTLHQTLDDIRALVETIAELLPQVLAAEGATIEEVRESFNLVLPAVNCADVPTRRLEHGTLELVVRQAEAPLRLQHETSIQAIAREEWNALLGANGCFDWDAMRFFEATFQGNAKPEDNWSFHYLLVRDTQGAPVAATFFTEALWKDDMLLPEKVSALVEERRKQDPYHLTSRVLSMGSLLTEGEHLYLDRGKDWRGALTLMLKAMEQQKERCGANALVLRDLAGTDGELGAFLEAQGFVKSAMPESVSREVDWQDEADYLQRLSHKTRHHQKLKVLPFSAYYDVEVLGPGTRQPGAEELAHFYRLYLNVKERNLGLNTFALPERLFQEMIAHGWELVLLRLRPEHGGEPGALPVGVIASYVGAEQYVPVLVGLDYRYVHSHGVYRQTLRHMHLQARAHGSRRLLLGMGAAMEKRCYGAKAEQRYAYLQISDLFNMEVLAQLTADVSGG